MKKAAKDRRPPVSKPVERVELSEKHFGRRMVAFLFFLVLGISALGYGVYSWLSTDAGWVQVESNAGEINCGDEFTLNYLLGESGFSATAELRAVRSAYNRLTVRAFRLFDTVESVEDENDPLVTHNLSYINAHPNEDIEVDPVLYQACALVEKYGSRAVYLGPLYSVYADLFFCIDDSEARQLDPFQSLETADFCKELASFARDPGHVQLELKGNNTLRLKVSDEYQDYAKGEGREVYLDFGWLRTAFIADYMADELAAQGLDSGMISSYDGVTRCLGGDIGQQVFSLYDWTGERGVAAAQAAFYPPVNAVSLRTFPLNSLDEERCYVFEDDSVRHWFIDPADGLCRASVNSLALYGENISCGELALRAEPFLISEILDHAGLAGLAAEGIGALAAEESNVLYTQRGLLMSEPYESDDVVYRIEYIGE